MKNLMLFKKVFIYTIVCVLLSACASTSTNVVPVNTTQFYDCVSIFQNQNLSNATATQATDYLKNSIRSVLDYLNMKEQELTPVITTDSSYYIFTQSQNIYISRPLLLSMNNKSELMSLLLHECIHIKLQDKKIPIGLNEKITCGNDSSLQTLKNKFIESQNWKIKENYADSLTLMALYKMNLNPKAITFWGEKKIKFMYPECFQHQVTRFLRINKMWYQLGMPSHFNAQKEYQDFKKLLN